MAKRQKTKETETRAPRVALISLGCAKNTVDAEGALGELLGAGFDLETDPAAADLILINTCGFIEPAREESFAVIEEMLSLKDADGWPHVAAMGCLSQRMGKTLAERFPTLDGVLGLGIYGELAAACERLLKKPQPPCGYVSSETRQIPEGPRLLLTPPSYAYLRIAEGCDNCCSYCAIPLIRGARKSRDLDAIVEEARILTQEANIQELILVAQDITAYGLDYPDGPKLHDLLTRLLAETEAFRIRLLYAHPAHLSDEVIQLLGTEPRLCGYLDLPIQHVNDRILTAMNRHYTRNELEALLGKLRAAKADMILRTSLIVGFPGETKAEFDELLAFVQAGHFQHLGAFAYSSEPGTAAVHLPERVPAEEVARRLDAVLKAQAEVAFQWMDARLGQVKEVLVDRQVDDGVWEARSNAEAPDVDGVIYVHGEDFAPGQRFRACLKSRDGYDIKAVLETDR